MPTSATGTTDRAASRRAGRHGGPRGFTLVELLIVLTLVGLLSAAVVVAMPDPRGSLVAEAERFAARAKAAEDRAVLDATGMAIRVTRFGYGFDRRDKGVWEPLDQRPFVDQPWGAGTEAALGDGAMRIVFDPTGIAEPAQVVLLRDGARATVAIGADGTIDVVR